MQINDEIDKKNFLIGVVGGGSWGTALANLLASKGYLINLWVFEKEVKDQILQSGENKTCGYKGTSRRGAGFALLVIAGF